MKYESFKAYKLYTESNLMKFPNGVYISLDVDSETQQKLLQYTNTNNIELSEDLHITLVYSDKPSNISPVLKQYKINTEPKNIELFGENHDVLVLEIHSPKLIQRNTTLVKQNGYVSDWAEYKSHITLQYDYKGDISKLPPITFPITVQNETVQNLNPEWTN